MKLYFKVAKQNAKVKLIELSLYVSYLPHSKGKWHYTHVQALGTKQNLLGPVRSNSSPYMWSLPIWRKPPDMAPPFTPSRRGSKNPDIYEFQFFAFAKS